MDKCFGKGQHKWKDYCIIVKLPFRMLRTPIKTRFALQVLLFQKTLEYQNVVSICYGRQHVVHLSSSVLVGQTWAIARALCDILLPMVK
jgi:hypothetical protein